MEMKTTVKTVHRHTLKGVFHSPKWCTRSAAFLGWKALSPRTFLPCGICVCSAAQHTRPLGSGALGQSSGPPSCLGIRASLLPTPLHVTSIWTFSRSCGLLEGRAGEGLAQQGRSWGSDSMFRAPPGGTQAGESTWLSGEQICCPGGFPRDLPSSPDPMDPEIKC